MTETDDRHLVEDVLDGRTDAFNLLVWRWQRPLYNFLLRLTGDRERAQDVSQEAFLRAYTRLKDLRERDKFGSWLFRIAVNLYRSDIRKRQAEPEEELPDVLSWDDLNGRLSAEVSDAQLTVRALIARLSAEQREVVLLKVYHGFHFDEIAVILNCPVSTVKSRLYAAFERLRAELQSSPISV